MSVQIQFRRGTAAAWVAANSVLGQGEIGLETDTKKFKVGDGTTAWNSIGYAAAQASHHTAHESGGADAITSLQAAILLAGEALFTQIPTPSNPASGLNKLYFKSNGQLYSLNSSGVETAVAGSGGGASDATLTVSDITTNNVSTSAHGFAPKAPNDTSEFLRGDGAWAAPTDASLTVSDVTTNNVSTTAHGFVPKAPNVTTEFLRGDGTWATPSFSGTIDGGTP